MSINIIESDVRKRETRIIDALTHLLRNFGAQHHHNAEHAARPVAEHAFKGLHEQFRALFSAETSLNFEEARREEAREKAIEKWAPQFQAARLEEIDFDEVDPAAIEAMGAALANLHGAAALEATKVSPEALGAPASAPEARVERKIFEVLLPAREGLGVEGVVAATGFRKIVVVHAVEDLVEQGALIRIGATEHRSARYAINPLVSLSDQDLKSVPVMTAEEIEAALEKGRAARERVLAALGGPRMSGTRYR